MGSLALVEDTLDMQRRVCAEDQGVGVAGGTGVCERGLSWAGEGTSSSRILCTFLRSLDFPLLAAE